MVRDDENIHMAKLIHGTHQLHLFVPGEIAEIKNAQLAECDQYPKRARVLGLIRGLRLRCFAICVLLSAAG